jgi:phage-related protein
MNNAEVLVKFKGDTKELDKATGKASSLIAGLGKGLGGVLATGAGLAMTAIAATTKAVADLTKASVNAYADYEQLIGGVETLFKNSADKVEAYANRAYETAGLSANEYMSTVTSFSASLLQSLGGDTDKAADYADRAIQDMSDNANKMGTDMSLIQSAYQGFAKQNYTMLDNLKLGYGGTKTEMERLLADAEKISGIHYDISSFADMTEAIHVIQNEMGITGTTAKEASTTITGSLNMTKSAWENLVAGFSKKDVNLDELIQQVIDSAMKFVDNVIPVLERALNGIANALPTIAQKLGDLLPKLIEDLLPGIIDAIMTLLKSITANLPSIIKTLADGIIKITDGLLDLLPDIIDALLSATISIIEALAEALPTLLPKLITVIIQSLLKIVEYVPQIIQAAITLLMGIVEAIPEIITALVDALPEIITTIITCLIEAIPQLIVGAFQLLFGLIKAIPLIIVELVRAIPEIIIALVDALTSSESLHQLLESAKTLLREFVNGIKNGWSSIANAGKDLIVGLWNGINDKVSWITNKIKSFGKSVLKSIKNIFGIHSPSTEFEWIGKMNVEGLEKGMDEMQPELQKTIDGMFDLQPNISGNMSNTLSPNLNVVVNNNMEVDPLGQVVNKIKTFSGGAKNDYNWGATR